MKEVFIMKKKLTKRNMIWLGIIGVLCFTAGGIIPFILGFWYSLGILAVSILVLSYVTNL